MQCYSARRSTTCWRSIASYGLVRGITACHRAAFTGRLLSPVSSSDAANCLRHDHASARDGPLWLRPMKGIETCALETSWRARAHIYHGPEEKHRLRHSVWVLPLHFRPLEGHYESAWS